MISILGLSALAVVNMELDDREEEAWSHSTVERGEASPTTTPPPLQTSVNCSLQNSEENRGLDEDCLVGWGWGGG